MTNSQQNLNNKADHQFGDGNDMTHAQKIEFLKTQQQMTNETKQTAVEWLEKEIDKLFISYQKGFMSAGRFIFLQHKLFQQAKEMEKEQIEKTYDDGIMKGRQEDGIQYYNETYGGNK